MSRTTIERAALALLLLCAIPVLAYSQGWRRQRGGGFEVSLPADWRVKYDAARGLTAASPGGEIIFNAWSAPRDPSRPLPSDPSALKERLTRQYELLNATDGTRYDVTTKSIGVETVNNLRGVVVELTTVVPARHDDGSLLLRKYAGFALAAGRGGTDYFATVLCPVSAYTLNSAVMNRIINDLRADEGSGTTTPAAGIGPEGSWLLSEKSGRFGVAAEVGGGWVRMRVSWRDAAGRAYVVEQRGRLREGPEGFTARGTGPAYVSTYGALPEYAPDTLLFRRQADGPFEVWIRDGVYLREWTPLRVESFTPARPPG
jgi:hypothetical protein